MKKKILSGVLALCMIFGSAAALPEGVFETSSTITASAATSGKFEYEVLDDGTVSIIKYNGEEENVNIPSNIKGKAVTCIGEEAFQKNEDIKSVVLPSTLKKIKGSSFDGAFSECISLTEIVIPANVTYIGCCAFKECTGLKKVTFKTGAKKEIDDKAFESCTNLMELDLGESVTAIGGSAFAGCEALKGKKVGNTYKLVIPDSVTRLYYDYSNGANPGYSSSAFSGCTSLEEVVIGKGVKEIGGSAFSGCTKLGKVTIGSNVTDIDSSAFEECFSECKSAASVIIPAKVKYIGREAFENCAKLQTVTFENGAEKYIDNFAFQNCTSLKNVNFGVSVTTIADSSFHGCTALEKLVIPDSVTKLGTGDTSWTYEGAFQGCTNLKEVKLGNGITEVGNNTFLNCTSLKSVSFGVNIKKIGASAFENCSSLEKVVLMPKTTTIEEQAFANCTSLKTAILTGVKQLVSELHSDNGSFYNCTKLSTVVMSEGDIKKIGDYAFVGCESLKTLTIPGSADTLGEGIYGYDEYDNAYSGITVRGVKDSKAQKYAKDNGFKFVAIAKHTCSYENVVVPSTCTEKGYTVNICKICGKSKITNTVKALGHKGTSWRTTAYDFAKNTSTQTGYCSVCGETVTKTTPNAVTRLKGSGRYATAAAISKGAYSDTASTVILANGNKYADALAGATLAKAYGAPILLTEANSLPSETLAEIKRLKATKVIILGGSGSVGNEVKNALKKNGLSYEIVKGSSRFETAVKIAEKTKEKTKKDPTEIFFVSSDKFADALSVSSIAALKKAPIIYLPKTGAIDDVTAKYLKSLKGTVKNAYVIGGSGVIGADVMAAAGKALGLTVDKTIVRVKGSTKYDTCVAVNTKFASVLKGTAICVATGEDFPDALAGGVFSAVKTAPLFLASGSLSSNQKNYLKNKNAASIFVLGGSKSVPDTLVQSIAKASV